MAVAYSSQANEPVADILGGIYNGVIDSLKKQLPAKSSSSSLSDADLLIPEVPCLGGIDEIVAPPAPPAVEVVTTDRVTKLTLPAQASRLPETKAWLEFVSGGGQSWLPALLTSPSVVQVCVCVCSNNFDSGDFLNGLDFIERIDYFSVTVGNVCGAIDATFLTDMLAAHLRMLFFFFLPPLPYRARCGARTTPSRVCSARALARRFASSATPRASPRRCWSLTRSSLTRCARAASLSLPSPLTSSPVHILCASLPLPH